MNDYKRLFGVDFLVKEINAKDLPVYISARRSFFVLSFSGLEFLLVKVAEKEKFGVVAFEKQAKLLSENYNMPVAFGLQNISRAQRDSMIERNVPFISDSGQLYLPFLGMALMDRFVQPKKINKEKMMPLTQALFLYLLYHSQGNPILKKDAADAIGVTRTSITRASEQLSAMGLISQEMHGKECRMVPNGKGMMLFDKAKPYLINPIQKTISTAAENGQAVYPFSGESALARKTMLNDPTTPVRAVYKADVDLISLGEVDTRWNPDADVVLLELWKYDPRLFEKNGVVDPVSLAMCLEDNLDERIEGALEEYLKGYQW